MKSMKKTIAAAVAIAMIFGCVVGGTIAWLIANSGTVVNTFTTSGINVTLTETDADNDKNANNNSYKMIPGHTIAKDPVASVTAGSEACYLFVEIEKSANYDTFLDEYAVYTSDEYGWTQLKKEGNKAVYYIKVDTATATAGKNYQVLAGKENYETGYVTVKGSVTKELMTADNFVTPTLTFTAYASQLYKDSGVEFDVADAWANISNPTQQY